MNFNAAIIEAAGRHLGVQEWPGARSNPAVEVFFARAGHPGLTDDVPWCAAFVGAVLAECGVTGTGSLMARSYARWGVEVARRDAMPGDVVVFPRGQPPSGHVGFFVRYEGERVIIRGGNQGDKVSDASYPAATILAIRRADPAAATGRATIRAGDKGAMVLDLQDQLARLGFFAGRLDGDFGALTRAAVLAFQAEHKLDTDGVVGARTWAALKDAQPRMGRDVSADDLRARGSTTIRSADGIDLAAGAAALTATATAVSEAAQQADGLLPVLTRIVTDHWPLLIVVALLVGAVMLSGRIKAARVRDAESGANLSR